MRGNVQKGMVKRVIKRTSYRVEREIPRERVREREGMIKERERQRDSLNLTEICEFQH